MTEDEKPPEEESISIDGLDGLEDDAPPVVIEKPEEDEPISLVDEGDSDATSTRRSYAQTVAIKIVELLSGN